MKRHFLKADIAANVAEDVEAILHGLYGAALVGLSLRPVPGQRFEVEATLELPDSVAQLSEPDARLRNVRIESSDGEPAPRLVRRPTR